MISKCSKAEKVMESLKNCQAMMGSKKKSKSINDDILGWILESKPVKLQVT